MMQTVLIFFCLLFASVLINATKIDRLEKKSKGKGAKSRSEVEEMFEEIGRGREKVKNKDGNGLRLRNEFRDRSGNKITRVEQEYDDLRVFGYHIIQSENQDTEIEELDRKTGKPTGRTKKIEKGKKLNGNFASELSTDLGEIDKTKLHPNDALEKLKTRYNNPITSNEHAESVIYIDQTTGRAQIAYEVGFFIEQSNEPSSPIALYSQDGKMIKEWNNVQSAFVQKGTGPGGNPKYGRFEYGQTEPFLDIRERWDGLCEHYNARVKVFDMRYQPGNGTIYPIKYDCYNHDSDYLTNRAYSPLNDALYFGTLAVDWYWYEYAEKPFVKVPIPMEVHYGGTNLTNAFCTRDGYLLLGDGDSDNYPLVTMDVVAHEIGHSVTFEFSDLIYGVEESGGLNEAFSDMAAAAGEAFWRYKQLAYWEKEESFNWEIGDEVAVAVNGRSRCMDNPPCDDVSIDHVNQFTPGMDPHQSSGIFNKVFYLLSKGFKFGIRDAFDLFYICNTRVWKPETNFTEAAKSTLKTAEEIVYDGDHLVGNYYYINITFIQETFKEVGINCWKDLDEDWECEKMLS